MAELVSETIQQPPLPPQTTSKGVVDAFIDNTSIGRVLDAFGQGAKDGWGAGPIGLSDESEKALRDGGIFKGTEDRFMDSFRTFNQAVIRPAAAALDAVMRGGSAVLTGGSKAVGQAAQELGVSPTGANRLTRDTLAVAQTLGIVGGTGPIKGPKVVKFATTDVPARPEGPAARLFTKQETPVLATDKTAVINETAVDKAGNINLDRIAAPEDVKQIIRDAAVAGGDFVEARRGTMTLADTEMLADAVGVTPETLMKRKVGQAFNAEESVKARNLLVQSTENVKEMARKALAGADVDALSLYETGLRHVAIQEQVAGITAEAGRALSAYRIMAKNIEEAKAIGELLANVGGRENIMEVAKRINELDTPQKVSKFLLDARQATRSDMFIELWINALLSGPQTHAVNTTSNALVALWSVPETALAATVGEVRQAIGKGGTERVMFGEAGARLFGFNQGAKEGIRAGWAAYKTETTVSPTTKLEVPRQRAIPSTTVKFGGREFEIGGKQVRIPGRLLMAADEFFKAIGYRQELNALAYRQAATEGLTGRAFIDRIAEIVNNPSEEFVGRARDNADYQTFTKALGQTGKAIQQFSNVHPTAKLIVPFVRTPVNIVKYAGERTPFGFASKKIRETLSGAEGDVARDTQIARIIMGSAVGTAAISLAAEGLITGGGPVNPAQRSIMYLTGWKPYSVKIGEVYYSYGRLEPLGTLIGVPADMYEIAKEMTGAEADKLANMVMASVSKNLVNKTWLSGPSQLIEAVTDPDRYGEQYVRHLVGTVVPTGVAQIARTQDPILRDARTMLDVIKSRTPGLSADVLPKRDIWGNPIVLEGGLGPDIVSPIYTSRIKDDPIAQEMIRLQIWPARLQRSIRGVELTPEQYDLFQQYAGRFTRYNLENIVKAQGWDSIPAFARREAIVRVINTSRDAARSLMLIENPEIIQQAVDNRIKKFSEEPNP